MRSELGLICEAVWHLVGEPVAFGALEGALLEPLGY